MSRVVCPVCNGNLVLTADGTSTTRRAAMHLDHKQEVHTCGVPQSWPGHLQWNPSWFAEVQDGSGWLCKLCSTRANPVLVSNDHNGLVHLYCTKHVKRAADPDAVKFFLERYATEFVARDSVRG